MLLIGLAVSAACADGVGPGDQQAERILFVSTRVGVVSNGYTLSDIHVMNTDGTGVENVTRHPSNYSHLALTPDGRTVIFEAMRPWGGSWTTECPHQIWAMGTDGSQLRAVTRGSCSYVPRVSPDGSRVLYQQGERIYVVNIDGSNPRDVSHGLPPVGTGCTPEPKWHVRPIGWVSSTRATFYRYICGRGYTYYAVNPDGSGLTVLDINANTAYLSPDQTRIAFDRMADWFNTTRLSVMNVDGSGPRALVDNAVFHDRFGYDRTPWSPNGQWIYYMTQDGHYVIDATAASPRRIAGADFRGGFNGWSPRGDRIAFTVNENGMQNIFVMNADGTGVVNLTNGASHNTQAIWLRR